MHTFIPISPTKEAWASKPFDGFSNLETMVLTLKGKKRVFRGQILYKDVGQAACCFSNVKELEAELLRNRWSAEPYRMIYFYGLGYVTL